MDTAVERERVCNAQGRKDQSTKNVQPMRHGAWNISRGPGGGASQVTVTQQQAQNQPYLAQRRHGTFRHYAGNGMRIRIQYDYGPWTSLAIYRDDAHASAHK